MALTLTIGTNTFVTLAETNSYLEGKIGAGNWFTLTDDEKKQCLISSFRWLVRLGVPRTASSTPVKEAGISMRSLVIIGRYKMTKIRVPSIGTLIFTRLMS